jgi:hypothetical protein
MQRLHKGGFISCCLIRKSSYHTHRQHHQRLYQLYQHHWYQSYASLRLVFPNLSLISLSFYLNHPLTKKKKKKKKKKKQLYFISGCSSFSLIWLIYWVSAASQSQKFHGSHLNLNLGETQISFSIKSRLLYMFC